LYLAHEDRFVVTPVGHVFAMYAAHQGGQAVRTDFSAPEIAYDRDGKPASFWGLKGSASIRNKELTLTVVNPDVKNARETHVLARGASFKSAAATVLTHSDLHAHNTFAERNVVVPKTQNADATGGTLIFRFPPASVTKLALQLS
jgi:alpha-L-arabinofuranosidase